MAGGLAALLDDIAALAKLAAASVDDVGAAASRASAKAAGVVVDDTAVTPRYVQGFTADRELPVIRRIGLGSLRNKLLVIVPAALLFSQFLPWALTPLLMVGGAYLCFEGVEKLHEHFFHGARDLDETAESAESAEDAEDAEAGPDDGIRDLADLDGLEEPERVVERGKTDERNDIGAALGADGSLGADRALEPDGSADPPGHRPTSLALPAVAMGADEEKRIVTNAIRTDFILSAEIIVIALNEVADQPLVSRTIILVIVSIAITLLVYGVVALIVKMDDIGLTLVQRESSAAQRIGRMLVAAMPKVLSVLSGVGIAAMVWVGGHIILAGTDTLGWHAPYAMVHHLENAVSGATGALGGILAWVTNTFFSMVLGVIVGAAVFAVLHLLPRRGATDPAATRAH